MNTDTLPRRASRKLNHLTRSFSLLALAAAALAAVPPAVAQSIPDPIPEPVGDMGLGISLEAWARIPNSPNTGRAPRLNMLKEVPGGSGFLWVNDQRGYLYRVNKQTGQVNRYLDIEALYPAFDFITDDAFQTGFSSFALDPEFASNGVFYTVVTVPSGTLNATFKVAAPAASVALIDVLLRWTATNPAAPTFSGTVEVVLSIEQPYNDHNVGEIAFNPTARPSDPDYGLLYIAVADGGWVYNTTEPDPYRLAQNLAAAHGKILRIDPRGTNSASGTYGIPADNPFVGTPGALPEIYSYGHRNPHRISWDPVTGMLYAFNIGTALIEEVNRIVPGGNYGWSAREGTFAHVDRLAFPLPQNDAELGYVYPIAQYDHPEPQSAAISGGFVYRGTRMPELYGQLLFADFTNMNRAFHVPVHTTYGLPPATSAPVYNLSIYTASGQLSSLSSIIRNNPATRSDVRWGQDADHELYILNKHNGYIYRVFSAPNAGDPAYIAQSAQWMFDPINGWIWLDANAFPWIYSARLNEWVPFGGI